MTRRPLMRTSDVAEALAIHVDDVRLLIRRGDLAAYDVSKGRRPDYRISEEQLDAYLAARRTRAA